MNATSPEHRVLVIDDDPDARFFARRWLERAGYEVVEAIDGTSGLSAAVDASPDVILLDVNMPDMDGFEVARRLRADPLTAETPIVHRTGSSTHHAAMADGFDAGATAYLVEPVAETVLVAAIRAAIRHRDQARRLDLALSQPDSGAFEWNLRTDQVTWSPSIEHMHGLPPGAFGGTFAAFVETVQPDDRHVVSDSIQAAIEGDGSFRVVYRARHASGRPLWIEGSGRIFRDAHGAASMLTGLSRDVTERERTRERAAGLLSVAGDLAGTVTVAETVKLVDDALAPFGLSAAVTANEVEREHLSISGPVPADPFDHEFVDTVIRLGSTAFDRAQLHARERRIAASLGHALMPSKDLDVRPFEVATRYVPASAVERVGGDFYDIVPVAGRLVVAVGDVAGHGIGAARDMAQLRGAVRAAALIHDGDPAKTIDQMGKLAANGVLATGNTATLVVASIHADGGGVIAAAGHPAPILVGPDGGAALELVPSPLLGIDVPFATVSTTFHLLHDQDLVVYTDGVIEERGEPVTTSIGRFAAALRVRMSPSDVLRVGRGAHPTDDDRVVVVVRRHR